MKKIISAIVALVMLLALLPASTQAEEVPQIVVENVEANPGETVSVDVSLANNPGINTFTLSVVYDKTNIQLTQIVQNPGLVGTFMYSMKTETLAWQSSSDTTYCGTAFSLTFAVAENAPAGDVQVTITYKPGNVCNYDEEDVDFTIVPGNVTILEKICEHGNKTEVPAQSASCTGMGNNQYFICKDCNKVLKADGITETTVEAEKLPALGHDFVAANCTAPKTCKVCGITEGEALGHSFTNYVSNGDATCTEDGTKTAKCDRCDVTDTMADEGSALGHDFADATCTAPKTCKVCGATEGEALGHSYSTEWSKGEEGHWHACSLCGDKIDEAAHDFAEGDQCVSCGYERAHVHRLTLVSGTAATCTEAGRMDYYTCSGCEDWFADAEGTAVISDKAAVVIPALGHDFADATCLAPKTCKVCGVTEGEALGHSFTNYVSNGDATCTADGTKTAKCDRCDVTDTMADEGSALGHDFADATCTAPKTCKICGATEGEALGHSYSTEWSKDQAGHWHECAACGHKIDDAAHEYGDDDICLVCKYEKLHVHELTLVPGTPATCTEGGRKDYYSCAGCADWFADAAGTVVITDKASVELAPNGHDFAEATCTEPETCTVCGAVQGEALGHADADEDGKCDRCEEVLNPGQDPEQKPDDDIPVTGDRVFVWFALIVLSVLGCLAVVFGKKRYIK